MAHTIVPNAVLTAPVFRTFAHFAGSSLVGLIAISTATIVDAIFVGRFVGPDALAAVNFLLPYFTFLFSVCLMLAVGGSVRAGVHLGAGNHSAASAVFGKSLVAAFIFSACTTCIGVIGARVLYAALGVPPELHLLVDMYLLPVSVALVLQLVTMVMYYFVRLDGEPVLATSALLLGAFSNIALDGLFILRFGWGLPGAAWATGVAQCVQLGVLLLHFGKAKFALRLCLPRSGYGELRHTALSGVPEFINEVSVGIVILVLNWLMVRDAGVQGVAAFAVVHYLIFISAMLYYGLADALHALLSQNFGAGQWRRIASFMRVATWTISAAATLFSLGAAVFGDVWASFLLPDADAATLSAARYFTLLVSPLFLVSGLNIMLTVYHTAVQQPLSASTIALSRTLIFPLAAIACLALWLPEQSPLSALAVAEWCSFALALTLYGKSRSAHPEQRLGAVADAGASVKAV